MKPAITLLLKHTFDLNNRSICSSLGTFYLQLQHEILFKPITFYITFTDLCKISSVGDELMILSRGEKRD